MRTHARLKSAHLGRGRCLCLLIAIACQGRYSQYQPDFLNSTLKWAIFREKWAAKALK
jgi:hypothetical protein